MGFLIIIPFAALAVWAIRTIFRWIKNGGYPEKWLRAFTILCGVGLVLGIWFAFFLHYTVAKIHLAGFPIPVAISSPAAPDTIGTNLLSGSSTNLSSTNSVATSSLPADLAPGSLPADTTMPLSIRIGATITDLLCGVALAVTPIALFAFFRENKGKLVPEPNSPP